MSTESRGISEQVFQGFDRNCTVKHQGEVEKREMYSDEMKKLSDGMKRRIK